MNLNSSEISFLIWSNLDVITLKEKLNSQANEFRSLNDKLKQCAVAAQSVMTFANQNQQNS